MKRALVVVDDSEQHRALLREAGELAAGVDAELILLSVLSEEEFEADMETIETIAGVENIGYGQQEALDVSENFAEGIASDELDGIDVDYAALGRVVEEGEHANAIIDIAEARDCDHVFLTGRRRSPAGKALFGDTAQSVILNFDGYVTVSTQ